MVASGSDSEQKETIRNSLRSRRQTVTESQQRAASEAVGRRLRNLAVLEETRDLAGYVAFDTEIDIGSYLEERLAGRAKVYLPRVESSTRMEFVPVSASESLEHGAYGIPEPTGDAAPIGSVDVFLVPGVGFDRRGHRLGMGKGFYDRALRRRLDSGGSPTFIGVAYDWQIVEEGVPTDEHDISMDMIVTDREIIS